MSIPSIIVTGSPAWAEKAAQLLREQGYRLIYHTDRAGYVPRLVNESAALVFVDSADSDWTYWIVTLKVEQATRRIPVIVVAHDSTACQQAVMSGADGYLPLEKLQTDLLQMVRDYARVNDPDLLAEMLCQCDEELPPRARLGIEKFNAGDYYKQHDLLEAQWMHETGPVRHLYRAILQVGIAYYHITRGNFRGAQKMLLRCKQWFSILPDTCQGVDVRQLLEDAIRVQTALEAMDSTDTFDRALLRPVIVTSLDTSG
jgi:predicted metal-dependent hydrolase/CheY-like chemotaxis protein